ncbi:DNA-binding protein [Candidatus Planktophila lacus]|uniref:Leader peptidase (Prepilin peptidase) / N-methyltransferase n=1 Tax=Candidatus Planktophila lacus TaxID=1884913 RepID=A0AAC9YSF1_9ACTN|nr:DNA-binding protein [Candidatus Planktophila lacus]ASY10648.1 leader peptidase (prepilin peptidase) / N-methyltransferase [Candidatus Planktophila lacus]
MSQITPATAFTQPTTATISARIRAQRKARSLTLQDIERLSNGRIKAVVMGSYERGSRAISLARTIEIANLFTIPLSELIEESKNPERGSNDQLIFDLRKLREISLAVTGNEISKINAFVSAICARRRDWNGEILTLRSGDLDTLTLVLSAPRAAVQELLERFQLVIKVPEI